MRFNPRARLDTSQVEGRGGGGSGGSMLPGGRIGGGVGGLIIVVLIAVFAPQLLNGSDSGGGQAAGPGEDFSSCTTGTSANESQKCRLVAITNSVQAFWKTEFLLETGKPYTPIRTVAFSHSVTTGGCGTATSDAGPFYCPNDQRVYLDLSFFGTLLDQLGGQDTAFTEAYVVAHEYGHHIQNLLGLMGKVRTQQGPNSDSVKLETMADCLAGAWAKHAQETPGADGQPLITDLTQKDIKEGIAAAKVVGDDAIQKRTSGRVNPEGWTHGSSAQREQAFNVGLRNGTIKACNFFDPANRNYPAS
jgi:predicted metalloprotease